MKRVVVVPARMASTRLPAKPLSDIEGIPMIVRVLERACAAGLDQVIAAVDDERVLRCVQQAGHTAMMTAQDHPSGSDRVAEVARALELHEDDVVINVQGDEPLVPPAAIKALALRFEDAQIEMATLSEPLASAADYMNPNVVKVVADEAHNALYFSRAPIPYARDEMDDDGLSDQWVRDHGIARHVGMYGFRVRALLDFVALPESPYEKIEKLEQLRWLQAGKPLKVYAASESIPGGVDTPQDLERVRELVRQAST